MLSGQFHRETRGILPCCFSAAGPLLGCCSHTTTTMANVTRAQETHASQTRVCNVAGYSFVYEILIT